MKDYKYNKHQRAWLDDLKKTRAKQGMGELHSQDGWCCLGRACYVLGIPGERRGDGNAFTEYFEGEDGGLPCSAWHQLKLRSDAGRTSLLFEINGKEYGSLTEANDNGCTFKQIAAAIEADPRNFFYD